MDIRLRLQECDPRSLLVLYIRYLLIYAFDTQRNDIPDTKNEMISLQCQKFAKYIFTFRI